MSQKRSLLSTSSTCCLFAGGSARAGVGLTVGTVGVDAAARLRYSVALETVRARQAGETPTCRDSPSVAPINSSLLTPGSPGLSPGALILFFGHLLWSLRP